MDDPGSPRAIIICILFILVNAFFAMGEAAIISLNDAKLRHDAEDGNKKARLISKLLSAPNSFSSTVKVAVTFFLILSGVIVADTYAGGVTEFFSRLMPAFRVDLIHGGVVFLLTVLVSSVALVIGELVPRRIAIHRPEKTAYAVSGIFSFLHTIFKPFATVLNFISNLLLKLFGIKPDDEPEEATEENIRLMLDAADERGTIEESEKEMINNIFEFDDRSVGEIMTHRKDITAIEIETPISDAVDLAISDGYSRMPVYADSIDNIKGIIYSKDLLSLIGDHSFTERRVVDFIRPASFIPESNSCSEVFEEFQKKKIQAAIVVDEYGGTAGLVSMEDLIESVMGNIQDEYDNEESEINEIDKNNFSLDGTVSLDELEDLLEITVDDDIDYDTLSGLIMDILGRIPEEDEHPVVTYQGVEFTVEQVEEHRIAKLHARILPKETENTPKPELN